MTCQRPTDSASPSSRYPAGPNIQNNLAMSGQYPHELADAALSQPPSRLPSRELPDLSTTPAIAGPSGVKRDDVDDIGGSTAGKERDRDREEGQPKRGYRACVSWFSVDCIPLTDQSTFLDVHSHPMHHMIPIRDYIPYTIPSFHRPATMSRIVRSLRFTAACEKPSGISAT